MKWAFPFLIFVMLPAISSAMPGDHLYVDTQMANVRNGPSTRYPVLFQLKEGQMLTEVSRQGNWVEADAAGTGKRGWIHASLVAREKTAVEDVEASVRFIEKMHGLLVECEFDTVIMGMSPSGSSSCVKYQSHRADIVQHLRAIVDNHSEGALGNLKVERVLAETRRLGWWSR